MTPNFTDAEWSEIAELLKVARQHLVDTADTYLALDRPIVARLQEFASRAEDLRQRMTHHD